MKKLLGAVLLAVTLCLSPIGCTSLGGGAHKAEVVTMPTVNAAMEQWKAHVLDGKATQKQVDAVKVAYKDYYGQQVKTKAAEIAWVKSKTDADQMTFITETSKSSAKGAIVVALIAGYMTAK